MAVGREIFGRDAEIDAALNRLAEGARLLTITGPPGIGKTRLALELFDRMREGPYEVSICDLSTCKDAHELVPFLARALGATGTPRGMDPLVAMLEERGPTLIVIDNAEQVAKALAEKLAEWLERCRAVRWLVTSQWRLDLAEEQILELAPLARADALALWIARVRQLRLEYDVETERPAVEALLEMLDAIPLAIELAASRRHLLTAHAMRERIAEGLAVLGSSRVDRPERHRTLEAAIAWAWELLAPWERTLLSQCSVFETDFTVDAIAAVARLDEGAPSIVDAIAGLRDKSMVQLRDPTLVGRAEVTPRFSLYSSVRAFAGARLAERADVLRRHAEWTCANAEVLREGLYRIGGPPAHRELGAELSNLRAVVERSIDEPSVDASFGARALISAFYALHSAGGAVTELSALLARFRRDRGPGDLSREHRAELAHVRGRIALVGGDLAAAEDAIGEMVTLAEGLPLRAQALIHLSHVAWIRRREDGRERLEQALSIARANADSASEGLALEMLGGLAIAREETEEGRALLTRAVEVFRAADSEGLAGGALCWLGASYRDEGKIAAAREALHRGRTAWTACGYALGAALATFELANVEHDAGELDEAVALYRRAIEELDAVGARRLQGAARCELGLLHRARGELERARDELARGVQRLRECDDARYGVLFHSALRAVLRELGETVEGEEPRLGSDDPLEHARQLHELRGHRSAARPPAASAELADLSYHVRQALRLLKSGDAPPSERELVVGPGLEWLRGPDGERHDLDGRPNLRRLLHCLLERRESAPACGLSAEELFAVGWPGERVLRAAGVQRVYVAIATLRKMGLQDVLLRSRDGYYIDPSVRVRSTDD